MARQRLGVVLLVPQPVATEIDGLRRALGDPQRERVAPHVTLVSPVNVHERDLPDVFARVRTAAAACAPLQVELGPVRTFAPVTPVAYLAVQGEDQVLDALVRLHDACDDGPLHREREQQHDFVPHVTVADDLTPARLEASAALLRDFTAPVTFDRVHVLAEQPGRRWVPIADAPLGAGPATVGRGSLPLALAVSGRPDLEAAALLSFEEATQGLPFAVTARRDGQVVGAAWGWTAGPALELADLVVAAEHRGQGIGRHLVGGVEDVARTRGCAAMGAWGPVGGGAGALLQAAGFSTMPDSAAGDRRRWLRTLPEVEVDAG